jgi:hypothetical protein
MILLGYLMRMRLAKSFLLSCLALNGNGAMSQQLKVDPAFSACGMQKAEISCLNTNQVLTSFVVCGGLNNDCNPTNLPPELFHSTNYKEKLASGNQKFGSSVRVPNLPLGAGVTGVQLLWPDATCMTRRGYPGIGFQPNGRAFVVTTSPVPDFGGAPGSPPPDNDQDEWMRVTTGGTFHWAPRTFTVYACVAHAK